MFFMAVKRIPKRLVELSLINVAAATGKLFVDTCEAEYNARIEAAADAVLASDRHLVMLTGPSGSGKTTSSNKIAAALRARGVVAQVISLDDFFLDPDKYPRLPDGSKDYENVTALDIPMINACLAEVVATGSTQLPQFDFITEHRKAELRPLTIGDGVLVVEGIHAHNPCLTNALPQDKVFKIYAGLREEYALNHDRVFAPMMAFLEELMFEPVLENGVFSADFVESEKRNLLSAIASQRNDKRAYAGSQMIKLMCKEDSFGIPRLGEPEDVEAITPESLYAHYRKILRESPVHVFYVGNAAPEKIADLIRPMFAALERDPIILPAQTAFHDCGGSEQTRQMDVTQGKLCMGFVTPVTLRDEAFVPMQIFNTIFGGGMVSKLFMKIREEMSLCYDISSTYHGSKGIMTVSAGIDNHMDAPVYLCEECGELTDGTCAACGVESTAIVCGLCEDPYCGNVFFEEESEMTFGWVATGEEDEKSFDYYVGPSEKEEQEVIRPNTITSIIFGIFAYLAELLGGLFGF